MSNASKVIAQTDRQTHTQTHTHTDTTKTLPLPHTREVKILIEMGRQVDWSTNHELCRHHGSVREF